MKFSIQTTITDITHSFVISDFYLTQIEHGEVFLCSNNQIVKISDSEAETYCTLDKEFKQVFRAEGFVGLLENQCIKYIHKEDTKFIISLPCKIENIVRVNNRTILFPSVDIQYIFKLEKCYEVPEPICFNIKKMLQVISKDTGISFNADKLRPVYKELYNFVTINSFGVVSKGLLKGKVCNILTYISLDMKTNNSDSLVSNLIRTNNNSNLKDSYNLSFTDIIKPKDLPNTSIDELDISYSEIIKVDICFIFKEQDFVDFDLLICTSPANNNDNQLGPSSFKGFIYYVYNKELNLLLEYSFESMFKEEGKFYICLNKVKEVESMGIFPLRQYKQASKELEIVITELFCMIDKKDMTMNICFGTSILKKQMAIDNQEKFKFLKTIDFSISTECFVVVFKTQTEELKTLNVSFNLKNNSLIGDVMLIYKSLFGCDEYYKLLNFDNKYELIKQLKSNISRTNKRIQKETKNTILLNSKKSDMFYQYCYTLLILNKAILPLSIDTDGDVNTDLQLEIKYVIELINSIYKGGKMNNISTQTIYSLLDLIDSDRIRRIRNLSLQRPLLLHQTNKQLHISKIDVNLCLFECKRNVNAINPNSLNPLAFLEIYGEVFLSPPYSLRTNPHTDALCNLFSANSINNLIINQPLVEGDEFGILKDNSLTTNHGKRLNTLDSDQKYIFDSDISHIPGISKKVLRVYSVQFPVVFKSKGNIDQTIGKHEASKKVKGLLIQYLLKRCFIIYGKLALVVNNTVERDYRNDDFKQISLEGLIVPENIKLGFEENEIRDISRNINVETMLEITKFLNNMSYFLYSDSHSKRKDNSASSILGKTLVNEKINFELSKDLSEFWKCNRLQQNSILLGSALSYINTNGSVYKVSKTRIERFLVSEISQFDTTSNINTEIGNNCIALISLGVMNFKNINKKYIGKVKNYFIQQALKSKENCHTEHDPLISYFMSFFVAAVSFKQFKSTENLNHTRSVLKYVSNYKQFNNRDINIANSIITGCLFFGSDDKNIAKSFYKNNNLRFQEEDPKVVYFSSICYYLIMHSKLTNLNDAKKFLSASNPTLLDINDLQHHMAKILITGIVNRNTNSPKLKSDLLHIYNEYSNIYLDGSEFNNFSESYVETFFAVVMLAYTLINTEETNDGIFDDIKNDIFLISTENTTGIYYYSVAGALQASKVKFKESDISTFCLLLSFIDHHQIKNHTENINGLLKLLFLKSIKGKRIDKDNFPCNNGESIYTLKNFDEYITKICKNVKTGLKYDLQNGLKERIIQEKRFVSNPYNLAMIKWLELNKHEEVDNNTIKVADMDSIKVKFIVDQIFDLCKTTEFRGLTVEDRCINVHDCLKKKLEKESYLYCHSMNVSLQEIKTVYNSEFSALNK